MSRMDEYCLRDVEAEALLDRELPRKPGVKMDTGLILEGRQGLKKSTVAQILQRLHANKAELLTVLDRPEIPLHTDGSERDIAVTSSSARSAVARTATPVAIVATLSSD